MSMIFDVTDTENKIKYSFKDKTLLRQAFTHSSYSNENKAQSYERLEFLGDSILNFIIAKYLYRKFPLINEGELTRLRSLLVSQEPLCEAVSSLKLGENVLFGEGEKKSENKNKIFANIFESVTAAIYLDGALKDAEKFILYALNVQLDTVTGSDENDCKSKLSEICQKKFRQKVVYKFIKQEGPPHSPVFTFSAVIGGKTYNPGSAETKKAAQQAAAKIALKALNTRS